MSGQTLLNKSSNWAHHLRYDFCIFLCNLLNYSFGSVSVYAECNYNYRHPASVISSAYSSFYQHSFGSSNVDNFRVHPCPRNWPCMFDRSKLFLINMCVKYTASYIVLASRSNFLMSGHVLTYYIHF